MKSGSRLTQQVSYKEALRILGEYGDGNLRAQAYIGLGNVAFYYRKNIEGLVYYHKAYQLQKMDNNVTAKKAFVQRDIKKRGFDRLSPDEIAAIKFFFQNRYGNNTTLPFF